METDRWLDAVLAEGRAAGAVAEVQVTQEHREDMVAADGVVGSLGESSETIASLRLSRDGRVGNVTAPVTDDPRLICARALDLLGRLPPLPPGQAGAPAREPRERGRRVPGAALAALAPGLAAQTGQDRGGELRCAQYRRLVRFAADGIRLSYETCGASLTYRLSYVCPDSGRKTHVEHGDAGPDLPVLAERLRDRVLVPSRAQVKGLANPSEGGLPDRVILEGEVAARLLALLAKGLSAEAVAHGRSRFAGARGAAVALPSVTVTDDPAAPGCPRYATFDDEGSPVRRRELISGGKLASFLGSRPYPDAGEGGCAWRAGTGTAPRPSASNLWLDVSGPPLPEEGPVLRVVQSQGMHTCNDITGEFSMGAFALVQDGSAITGVAGMTVAGNVYDVLRTIEAAGSRPHWIDGGDGYYGSPHLMVRGLSAGR